MAGLTELRWYYFQVTSSGLRLVPDWWFPPRPSDAQSANGNPHTPWYAETSHADKEHAHIYAASEKEAKQEALRILQAPQESLGA